MKKNTLNIALAIALSGLALSANADYNFTTLGTLGGTLSIANGINNAGQVVGESQTSAGISRATIWNGGTVTDLGAIGTNFMGLNSAQAYAINNLGQVAGKSTVASSGVSTGFGSTGCSVNCLTGSAALWNGASPAVATSLGTPRDLTAGTYGSYAGYAINDKGQVAGLAYNNTASTWQATLWNGSNETALGSIGGSNSASQSSTASGINNSGQVVGSSDTASFLDAYGNPTWYTHATIWNGTTATDLGTLGGTFSTAAGINNIGQVVGYATTSEYTDINGNLIPSLNHATLWNGNVAVDLGTLGGDQSYATAINNSGLIVGISETAYSVDANGNSIYSVGHATLWRGNKITDLNSFLDASAVSAGWVLSSATGINGNGWIIGNATNTFTGSSSAYLLSVAAVPEPDTYGMMLMGLGFMGFTVRRRKNAQA